jgi:hypothetical protein
LVDAEFCFTEFSKFKPGFDTHADVSLACCDINVLKTSRNGMLGGFEIDGTTTAKHVSSDGKK